MTRRSHRLRAAALPWLGAALLWLGLIAPLRADQESRLARQGHLRRERLAAEQERRQTEVLRARLDAALKAACRASSDPAAMRQRAVASTDGLALSPFSLSVGGGAGPAAMVEAEGTYEVVTELLRRLGDPGRGGFLRTASLRVDGGRWMASASVGALEDFPRGLLADPGPCSSHPVPDPPTAPVREPVPIRSGTGPKPPSEAPAAVSPPSDPSPAPTPGPPFSLVAFLTTEGKARVSLAVRGEVRVVSVGDRLEGWTCVSIDPDLGATFTSPSLGRLTLKPQP